METQPRTGTLQADAQRGKYHWDLIPISKGGTSTVGSVGSANMTFVAF